MTNTAIQLSAELKAAIAEAAQRAGMSEHDYILAAIHQKLIYDDPALDDYDEAERRWQEFQQTGMAIPHEEVIEYFERRMAGEKVDPPKARKIKA
ncbi:hypothetical protein [Massilia sp. NR 4-1]|uniref:hypothetical protein n=1 Tax=Massilia sp. NR 4-1 TaxID=1678028 RepID=UPI00067A958B|nr:hypothetical protein [Massilia sp. NR 4-1]AKU24334.1 hypothetical protein ACZ75_25620 [Massilia sp. NR 4-1]